MAVVHFGNPHRTAYRESIVVPSYGRPEQASVPIVRERHARVEGFIGEIFVAAAVKLVGARLHGDVVDRAARQAEFSCKVAGLNGELLDRIHASLRLGGGALA